MRRLFIAHVSYPLLDKTMQELEIQIEVQQTHPSLFNFFFYEIIVKLNLEMKNPGDNCKKKAGVGVYRIPAQ